MKTVDEILSKYSIESVSKISGEKLYRQNLVFMAMEEYAGQFRSRDTADTPVNGMPNDEDIAAMIKTSELKERSADEWLSLFEGAKWLIDEILKRHNNH